MINCSTNNEKTQPCYGIFWAIGESESELTESNLFCVVEPYIESNTAEKSVYNHKKVLADARQKDNARQAIRLFSARAC